MRQGDDNSPENQTEAGKDKITNSKESSDRWFRPWSLSLGFRLGSHLGTGR